MKYSFREWLKEKELNEVLKDKQFNIIINNDEFLLSRESHLFHKSRNDNKPKDFKMTKTKYLNVMNAFINSEHNTNLKKPVTITWEENGKNNAISVNIDLQNKKFEVFGAIMGSKNKDPKKLYADAQNRFHIGNLK